MTQFKALLRLELSQWKLAFSMNSGRNKKKDRAVARTLGILALMVFVAFYMVILELKVMDVLEAIGRPILLPKLLVAVSMILTFVTGLFQIISSLYFSRDVAILGFLPVKNTLVYTARMTAQLIQEIVIGVLFIIPPVIIYFIRIGFDAGLLARALLVTCLSPVIPMCLSALLAGLLTKVPGFWRHREIVTTIFSIVIIFLSFGLSFTLSNMTSSAADDQEAFRNMFSALAGRLDGMTGVIPPIRWFSSGMEKGGLDLVWGLLGSGAAWVLICFLFGRDYLPVASHALENAVSGKKVDMAKETIRGGSPMAALVRREMREMIRTPAYLTNGLLLSLLMPVMMVGVMLFSMNSAMEGGLNSMIREFDQGGHFQTLIAVIITGVMSLMMGMNSTAATGVSREGNRHALMRSLPVSSRTIIRSKLYTAVIFQWIGILPAVVVIGVMMPDFLKYDLMILVWSFLLAFIGACLGLIIDAGRPRMDWINETQAIKSGFNQVISLLVYLAMLGLIGIGTDFGMDSGMSMDLFAALMTAVILLMSAGCWLWLGKAVKAYDRIGE